MKIKWFCYYGRPDFLLLAERFGIASEIATGILDNFPRKLPEVEQLVRNSFLPDTLQLSYLDRLADRLLALR